MGNEVGAFTFLGVFLMGLALNLTPCVYPMLSVTVALFGGQQERVGLEAFGKALCYVVGIATMYSLLGVLSAFGGVFFGALLQNPLVLIVISVVLILLGLSMFGIYTLQFPPWILKVVGQRREVSMGGVFLSGLFVGIFAAPCIGPPIIGLMTYVGTRGDPVLGFQMFFVMSLGLGMPYLILGSFSGLAYRLPKSGAWLVWIERIFGVILLTLASFYLLLVFYPQAIDWLIPVALVVGGIYLGFMDYSDHYSPSFIRFKQFAGILSLFVGLLIPVISSKESVQWEPYSAEKLQEAVEERKPVMMEFYADWCLPCYELERVTYTDSLVIESLDYFTRIKVDVSRFDSFVAQEALSEFQVIGIPTILFLDPWGREIKEARINGFIPPEELLFILHSPEFQKRMEEKDFELALNERLLDQG